MTTPSQKAREAAYKASRYPNGATLEEAFQEVINSADEEIKREKELCDAIAEEKRVLGEKLQAELAQLREERDEARNALTNNLWSEWEMERAKTIVERNRILADNLALRDALKEIAYDFLSACYLENCMGMMDIARTALKQPSPGQPVLEKVKEALLDAQDCIKRNLIPHTAIESALKCLTSISNT